MAAIGGKTSFFPLPFHMEQDVMGSNPKTGKN